MYVTMYSFKGDAKKYGLMVCQLFGLVKKLKYKICVHTKKNLICKLFLNVEELYKYFSEDIYLGGPIKKDKYIFCILFNYDA